MPQSSFSGRLVTGGWVMNDEANTHVNAIVSQFRSGTGGLSATSV